MVDLKRFACAAAAGEYVCADCGYVVVLHAATLLPICPAHNRGRHAKNGWRGLYGRAGPVGDAGVLELSR